MQSGYKSATSWARKIDVLQDHRNTGLRGRDFTAADRKGNLKVAIINEELAHYYFGDVDPIGRWLSIPWYRGDSSWPKPVSC
jgi:hypothetical protein